MENSVDPDMRCQLIKMHIVFHSACFCLFDLIMSQLTFFQSCQDGSSWAEPGPRVCKQPITALYFEFETILKFYKLGACTKQRISVLLKDTMQCFGEA